MQSVESHLSLAFECYLKSAVEVSSLKKKITDLQDDHVKLLEKNVCLDDRCKELISSLTNAGKREVHLTRQLQCMEIKLTQTETRLTQSDRIIACAQTEIARLLYHQVGGTSSIVSPNSGGERLI